ncbi:DgyrCDS12211 [Dimorphilus gyrociliatus]|uniref:26S proteasome non-ATPase regulatory subunit 8 n=1 Tax=Dimorphilus gyrociliatus TaxID=2664684 RepID=A0A7I8W6M2_9ANNE|nr:DgyrCDS12211 [Dimorphilus gyrociliatus]
MDAELKEALNLYHTLSQEWNKKPPNLEKCGNFLEIGAQYAIACKDVEAFERYMSQLKTYYFDYKDNLQESSFMHELLGLNLLRLLAQNKLADFHTEMELLPIKLLYTNIYIRHPVSIEQYLMEGAYNKVFLAKGNVPAESYIFFMNILLNTIRDEIASCLEKAYNKIDFSEAARMLFFESEKPMTNYAEKKQWIREGKCFVFKKEEKKMDDVIASTEMAEKAIAYARELEIIV